MLKIICKFIEISMTCDDVWYFLVWNFNISLSLLHSLYWHIACAPLDVSYTHLPYLLHPLTIPITYTLAKPITGPIIITSSNHGVGELGIIMYWCKQAMSVIQAALHRGLLYIPGEKKDGQLLVDNTWAGEFNCTVNGVSAFSMITHLTPYPRIHIPTLTTRVAA